MFLVPMSSTKYSKLSTEESDDREDTPSITSTIGCIGFFFRRYFRLLVEITGLTILLYLIWYIRSAKFLGHAPIAYSVLPRDVRQAPSLVKTFEGDPDYEGYSNATRHAWDSLMPRGRGFIPVENPAALGLKAGIRVTDTADRYGISAFHQIHCLAIVRESYYELRLATPEASPQHSHHASRSAEEHHNHQELVHIDHCFDYIRQAIMCAADPSVEHASSQGPVDGWGVEHQCRSWEKLFDFAFENRVTEIAGVLNIGDSLA